MKIRKRIFFATFIFCLTAAVFGYEADDTRLHLLISEAEAGFAPIRYGESLLFGFKPEVRARHVGIAFNHENFSRIHSLVKNDHGVYILNYPLPEEEQIVYRYVVDGLWREDPLNLTTMKDHYGVPLSVFTVDEARAQEMENISPVVETGYVVFTFFGAPDSSVFLIGDFNRWDPFINPMPEKGNGIYSLRLRIRPGRHYYNFVVDGHRTEDPLNPEKIYNYEGMLVSILNTVN